MPMTMMRINLVYGIGPVLQVVEGYSVDLPKDVSDIVEAKTDRAWPSTFFVPNTIGEGTCKDVYSVMANWGSNHCALTYGHIGDLVITLASMLRIPVALHNVPNDRIFRPHIWGAYGQDNSTASDILACKELGPLYK